VARPPRLEHPGALWHVSARGAGRAEVFVDDADRTEFLSLLARTSSTFGWRLHAWALAARSYELLVETPEPTLSRGMRDLNGVTTQRFNRRHGRSGPSSPGASAPSSSSERRTSWRSCGTSSTLPSGKA
jgi:Transposase IS200 like.